MNTILTVTGLNKSYEHFSLKDITFSIPEGCITGFIGINGAGKTTTIRTLCGLTPRQSGSVNFFDLDLDKDARQIKNRIGIILDDGCFFEELSLNEMKNILAPAYTSWSDSDFRHYLDLFSLDSKQKISTLSKGMKMKFSLALALSHNADFLILDEPTNGLDPLIRSQFWDILKDYMNHNGKGVLLSTHITSDLDKIADTILMIDQGHIVFHEEKDTLLDSYRLVKGASESLTDSVRPLLRNLSETAFGFTALTKHISKVRSAIPDAIFEFQEEFTCLKHWLLIFPPAA